MKFEQSEKYLRASLIWFALFGALAGVLLIAIPTDLLLKAIFVIVGVITAFYNFPGLITGLLHLDTVAGKLAAVLSGISIAIGVAMIFFHSTFLMVILGAYLLIFPLIQIAVSGNRSLQIKTELPKIILGIVLLIIGPAKAIDFIFDVVGWAIIVMSAIYVLISLLVKSYKKTKYENSTGNRVFVDTTGDGKIDTVYVDTTGDGKPDTAKRYRDDR